MASFSAAAKLLASALITDTREDGSSFIKTAPDSPDWIRDAIREAHDGEFPNDARYSLISDAATSISDQCFDSADDARESVRELSGDIVPICTADQLAWFAGNTSRLDDCDAASEELSCEHLTIFDLLSLGYQQAAESVLFTLIEAIEDNHLAIFNPDTDSRLLLSDSHGVYIPQIYCEQLTEDDAANMGVEWSDVVCCQSGPDQEWYWESWQAILDSAEIIEPATLKEDESHWRLIQNGDLWQVRSDVEIPEEWF